MRANAQTWRDLFELERCVNTPGNADVDRLRLERDRAIRWTGADASVECLVQHFGPGHASISPGKHCNPE